MACCPIRAVAWINEPDILFRNAVLVKARAEKRRRMVCMVLERSFRPLLNLRKDCESRQERGKDSPVPAYF